MAGAAFLHLQIMNEHGWHRHQQTFQQNLNQKWRRMVHPSPATALASKVLPVPGGPSSSTPAGIRAPSLVKRFGSFKIQQLQLILVFLPLHLLHLRNVP